MAREFVSAALVEWGRTDRLDDIRLCVSELVTNALLHGVPTGREMCVAVTLDTGMVRIEVRDSGDGSPHARRVTPDACSGRGLWLVREVADDFGIDEHSVGKTVWAVFKAGQVTAS